MVGGDQLMYASPDVIALPDADGYAVLLCLRTGRWHLASPVLAQVWHHLAAGTDLTTAITAAAARYQVPASVLEGDLPAAALARARLLTTRRRQPGPVTAAVTASGPPAAGHVTAPDTPVAGRYRAAAAAAFAAVVVLRHAPLRAQIRVLHLASRLPARTPAAGDGAGLVTAARRAARRWPGSAECYEISMTAFLAGVLTGRTPRWCLGARLGPFSPHAWIEAGDTVIDTDAPQASPCRALIRI
jgi:hypothetical protein